MGARMDRDRVTGEAFPAMKNTLMLDAAQGKSQSHVPVWVMRQAGRYLPEYHEVRNKAQDFFNLCETPAYACEMTLQPIDRFALDGSIIFSDILVIPKILGLECVMKPGKGPIFPEPLQGPEDLQRLKSSEEVDVKKDLSYTIEAVRLVRHSLNGRVPLIGFTGAPWTLMAYMIEGEGSKTFSKAKSWLYRHPEESHQLLQTLTDVIVEFLVEQAKHGAQLLKVFDSWAGILTPDAFSTFCLPYYKAIEQRVRTILKEEEGFAFIPPMILFAKGAHFSMEQILRETTYEVISLDWETDVEAMHQICKQLNRRVCFQGNLGPCILYGTPETIRQHTKKMVQSFYDESGLINHIANLGHGVYPDHDPERVGCFIDAVHEFSKEIYPSRQTPTQE